MVKYIKFLSVSTKATEAHSSWKGFQGPWKPWRYLNGAGLLDWTAESLSCCKPTETWSAFFADCSRLSDPGSLSHGFKPQLNGIIHLDVLTKLAARKSEALWRLADSALEVSSLQQDVLGKTSAAQWVLKTYSKHQAQSFMVRLDCRLLSCSHIYKCCLMSFIMFSQHLFQQKRKEKSCSTYNVGWNDWKH